MGSLRTAVIRKTALIGPYSNSDDTFLAELILRGQFREVPEPLFFYRIHSAKSTSAYPNRSARMAWFKPNRWYSFLLAFSTAVRRIHLLGLAFAAALARKDTLLFISGWMVLVLQRLAHRRSLGRQMFRYSMKACCRGSNNILLGRAQCGTG